MAKLRPKATPEASGIPVRCAHTEIADVTTLVPHPRNPNKHGDKQVALLAKIIRHQGWRNPIVVSNRSGFIIGGHGRLHAAMLLQVEHVPVDRQDFANEADEWAHLVADNRIAELADMQDGELLGILRDLEGGGLDLELAGFDEEAFSALINPSTDESGGSSCSSSSDSPDESFRSWYDALPPWSVDPTLREVTLSDGSTVACGAEEHRPIWESIQRFSQAHHPHHQKPGTHNGQSEDVHDQGGGICSRDEPTARIQDD